MCNKNSSRSLMCNKEYSLQITCIILSFSSRPLVLIVITWGFFVMLPKNLTTWSSLQFKMVIQNQLYIYVSSVYILYSLLTRNHESNIINKIYLPSLLVDKSFCNSVWESFPCSSVIFSIVSDGDANCSGVLAKLT